MPFICCESCAWFLESEEPIILHFVNCDEVYDGWCMRDEQDGNAVEVTKTHSCEPGVWGWKFRDSAIAELAEEMKKNGNLETE